MRCRDAREGFSVRRRGGISLTEWALVEAHLRQCAECRREEGARAQPEGAARRVTRPLLPLAALPSLVARAVGAAIGATGRGIGHCADLITGLRGVVAAALTVVGRAGTVVIRAIGGGIGQTRDLIARLRAVFAALLSLVARAVGDAIEATGRGIGHCAALIARRRAVLRHRLAQAAPRIAIPLRISMPAAGVGLVLALALSAPPWPAGPRQHDESSPGPGPGLESAQAVSFLPPPPVAPSLESNRVAPAAPRVDVPRQSPSKASAPSSEPLPVRHAPVLAAPGPERAAPAADVVGRLVAGDRMAAERDLTAMLAGVGGTELDRQRRGTFTTLNVTVPHTRYDDFTRGLSRLGSWQLEAARSSLPDVVRVTIRVSE